MTASVFVENPEQDTPIWRRFGSGFLVFVALIALAYFPLLARLAMWLWNRDHYSFFPLALVAGAVLLFYVIAGQHTEREPPVVTRRIVLGLALAMLCAAVLLVSPWLGGASAMVMLLAVLYAMGGWQLVRRAMPIWALLWLIVPIPLSFDQELILALRRAATRISSGILDLLGYSHVVDGVVIRLQERSYGIEDACSGIQSLFSILFCVGLYCVITRSHILRSAILLIFSAYTVLVANVARIVAVVVLREQWGLPFHEGFLHKLLGFVVFAVTLLIVFSFDRFLSYLWPSSVSISLETLSGKTVSEQADKQPRPCRLSWFGQREVLIAGTLLAMLGGLQMVSIAMGGSMAINTASNATIPFLLQDDPDQIPEQLGEWRRVGYRYIERDLSDINGERSRLWVFEKDGMRVEASVDGPFLAGWHYLTFCYRVRGWRDSNIRYCNYRDHGQDIGGDYIRFDVANADEHGHVVFGFFDKDFRAFTAPKVEKLQRHLGRVDDLKSLIAQFFGYGDETVARSNSVSCQIQIFHHGPLTLDAQSRQNCEELYLLFREAVSNTVGSGR